MFTIALVVLSLVSLWALMTRFDRMASAMSNKMIWPSVICGVMLIIDIILTGGAAFGASAVMGVIQGGPIGIFAGLLFSIRIERWYSNSPALKELRSVIEKEKEDDNKNT